MHVFFIVHPPMQESPEKPEQAESSLNVSAIQFSFNLQPSLHDVICNFPHSASVF